MRTFRWFTELEGDTVTRACRASRCRSNGGTSQQGWPCQSLTPRPPGLPSRADRSLLRAGWLDGRTLWAAVALRGQPPTRAEALAAAARHASASRAASPDRHHVSLAGLNPRRSHAPLWRTLGRRGGCTLGLDSAEARSSPFDSLPRRSCDLAGSSPARLGPRPVTNQILADSSLGDPAGLRGGIRGTEAPFPPSQATLGQPLDLAGRAPLPTGHEVRWSGSAAAVPAGDAGCLGVLGPGANAGTAEPFGSVRQPMTLPAPPLAGAETPRSGRCGQFRIPCSPRRPLRLG